MVTFDFIGNNGDGLPSGLTADSGSFEIQNNALVATGASPGGPLWVATTEGQSDDAVTATINYGASPAKAGGVIFRYVDNDNMLAVLIVASDTNPILKLFERSGGSWNTAAEFALASVAANQDYKIDVIFDGDDIEVYLDDVLRISHTTSLHNTATRHGVRLGNTEQRIQSLTVGVSSSISLDLPDYFFRKQIGGERVITLSGSYTGEPTSIEYSADGETWQVGELAPTDNSFSFEATLSTGQYDIHVRFADDHTVNDVSQFITIAEHVFVCGFQTQSNMDGRGANNQSYSPNPYRACMYSESGEYRELSDPWQENGGSWFIRFVDLLYQAGSGPVAVVVGSQGGTSADDWVKGNSTTNLYDDLLTRCLAVGGATLNFMQQGERDSKLETTNAAYIAQTNENINNVFNDLAIKTFIVPLHQITASGYDGNGTTTGQAAIRAAQISISDSNSNVWRIGPDLTDIDLSAGDGLHFETNEQLQTLADRVFSVFMSSLLNVNVVGIPDGAYQLNLCDAETGQQITFQSITAIDEAFSVTVPALEGTHVKGYIDNGSLVPNDGAFIVGLTE